MKDTHHGQFLAVLILAAVMFPLLATQAAYRSTTPTLINEDTRTPEQVHQAVNWRGIRSDYARAMMIYRSLLRNGYTDVDPPSMDNLPLIRTYLDPVLLDEYITTQKVEDPVVPIEQITREFPEQEKRLLRLYVRAGYCPESLRKSFISGLLELCLRLAGPKATTEPVQGLLNEQAALRRLRYRPAVDGGEFLPPRSLMLRLKVQEDAKKVTDREMQVPLRFQRAAPEVE